MLYNKFNLKTKKDVLLMKKVFASVLSLSILLGSVKVSFASPNNGQVASQEEKKESTTKITFSASVPVQTQKTTSKTEENQVDNKGDKQGELQPTNLTVNVNVPGKSSANSAPAQEQPKAPKANNILAVKTYLDDTIEEMNAFLEKADHETITCKIEQLDGEIAALKNYLNNLEPLVKQFPSLNNEIRNVQIKLLTLNYKKDRLNYAKKCIDEKDKGKFKRNVIGSIAGIVGAIAVTIAGVVGYSLLHR